MNAIVQTPDLANAYEVVIDPERPWLELRLGAGATKPTIVVHPGLPPPKRAIVQIGADTIFTGGIMVWGEFPQVTIGARCLIPEVEICCGDTSVISIGNDTVFAVRCHLNARHSGRIVIGSECLIGVGMSAKTDDMHTIRDRSTGQRVNARGGHISVGDHVWLGCNTKLRHGAVIGNGSVIGEDTRVVCNVPEHVIACGSPVRVVRENIEWDHRDLP